MKHQHLIVRAEVTNPPKATDCADIEQWLRKLINDIDMKVLADPRARYCAVEGNRGMTADALIETSHVVLHSWDECTPAVVQFDIYTCSELPCHVVFSALERFSPTLIEHKFLDRETGLILLPKFKKPFIARVGDFFKRIFSAVLG